MTVSASIRLVPGFAWCGQNIGIKDQTLDFGAIFSESPCTAAGVFTRNNFPGAPVIVGREHLRHGSLQAVVVNSKNSNVATGPKGIEDARQICRWAAESLGITPEAILPSSTGVIGRYLPMEKLKPACLRLREALGSTEKDFELFARAIMTTDTRPKWVSARVGNATILGVAKGAGMIEPNMATMLCYFMTDASIDAGALQAILRRGVERSFNRISIDTDTSTSDTVVILANGLAGTVDLGEFEAVFSEMALTLAKAVVSDGEGVTKLIELKVSGADSAEQALVTAKAVINSPLVKTAIYGADPNWGRFVMAIGKVFQYPVPLENLQIFFGREAPRLKIDAQAINENAVPLAEISAMLKHSEIYLEISLGTGPYSETVWGGDLTEGYIRENAYYTT